MEDPLLEFGGRLHVVLVHLPVGLGLALATAEAAAWLRRSPRPHAASAPLATALAASSVAATATGFLSEASGRAGAVDPHRTAALIATATALGAVLLLRARTASAGANGSVRWFRLAVLATTVALGVATWKGTGLTHGDLLPGVAAAGIRSDDGLLPSARDGTAAPAPPSSPPDAALIEALRAEHVHVEALTADRLRFWVDFGPAGKSADDALVARLLEPMLPYVVHLGLARTSAGEGALRSAARCPNLERLDLSGLSVGADDLRPLAGHRSLQVLNLTGCATGDGAAALAATLPRLRRIFVFGTGIGPAGLAALGGLPGLEAID